VTEDTVNDFIRYDANRLQVIDVLEPRKSKRARPADHCSLPSL
jgi:hypothetical protein